MDSSYKKGQIGLQGLYTAVMAVVLIGIAIGIGIFVLNETADATSTQEYTTSNETHTAAEISAANGVSLSGSSLCGSQLFVITSITNATNTTQLPYVAANYSVSIEDGRLTNLTNDVMGTGWNISYTYKATSDNGTASSCRSLTTVGTGIGGFADWIAVIIVTLAAAVVLGLVINSFGRRRAT